MKLNVSERLLLLFMCVNWEKRYLPNLTSKKVMFDFGNDLGFTQEEIDKLEFNKNVTDWNKKEDKAKEIKVGNRVQEIIQNELRGLERKGKLNFIKHFSLCEKFGYVPQER